jgi:hypothetical protein
MPMEAATKPAIKLSQTGHVGDNAVGARKDSKFVTPNKAMETPNKAQANGSHLRFEGIKFFRPQRSKLQSN